MSVSAIVVTYNRLNLLKDCLKHLLNQNFCLDNIFVINNNSYDGTTEYLNNLNSKIIKPINTDKNLGGAGGFSLGTKIAFEKSTSKYFWLMDDDTMPMPNALSKLVNSVDKLHTRFGYLCSNVRWWKNNNPSYLNVPVVSADWNDYVDDGLVKTISASFVSLFVPRYLVKLVGLPIADMFIWGDDVEYTTRLSRLYPSYLVADSIVVHKSKTNSTNESVYNVAVNRLFYYKCMFRNRIYISRKYYNKKDTFKLLIKYLFYLCKVPFVAKNNKLLRFVSILEGIINGLFFNPRVRFPDK